MKKIKSVLAATFVYAALVAFTPIDDSNVIGTYGVSDTNPSHITLVLNEDHSFTYQDFSVPDKKIQVQGQWISKNNRIKLQSTDSDFHSTWMISKDGMKAKSRKGLCFYSLRRK